MQELQHIGSIKDFGVVLMSCGVNFHVVRSALHCILLAELNMHFVTVLTEGCARQRK